MIRFIWKNWWRRKERFFLLVLGALIISAGLSFLVGLSDANKGTIVDELQKRWSASYDIVVRPEGSRNLPEEDHLLDPNYLSGINGGISVEQYEQIKEITDIEIAAPIAMLGYMDYTVKLSEYELEDGIYRLTREETTYDGVKERKDADTSYFAVGHDDAIMEKFIAEGPKYYVRPDSKAISTSRSFLVAGVDPEQEAKLVGLDEAMLDVGGSRYFNAEDVAKRISYDNEDEDKSAFYTSIPVILNSLTFTDGSLNFTIEQLDIPIDSETFTETLEDIEANGGEEYLDSVNETDVIESYTFTDKEINSFTVNTIAGFNMVTGESFTDEDYISILENHLQTKASLLTYEEAVSPFRERWPYAYKLKTFKSEDEFGMKFEAFQPHHPVEDEEAYWESVSIVKADGIGFYDPGKIKISQDPTTELPMETYRPATAELVVDEHNQPVNPPQTMRPMGNINVSNGFLGNPPTMLTTIEAARKIGGDTPISAIRIKVAGVKELTEESQVILERVAKEIEDRTGLLTDITLGSSPQPTLTYVPETSFNDELGWVEQPWVKIGASMTIFKEARIGFEGIILCVIAVAVLYVWASSLVSLLARRKEFAILLAIGWRPQQLGKLLILESAILGGFVAIISWIIVGVTYLATDTVVSPLRFLLTGAFGFMIYLLGAIVPAYLSGRISPYEAMRTGEISTLSKRVVRTRGVFSMACNHFIGKWRRNFLSIIAIAIPTSLLALFIYITFRLQGIMYTTWLGQYVTLEIGAIHYIAMGVALVIAILTTAEIVWQNIMERQQEMGLLKAIGWENINVRKLIWLEGIITGVCAGVISILISLGMLWAMYGELPTMELPYILLTGFIPIIVGVLGTVVPAERAVIISAKAAMD